MRHARVVALAWLDEMLRNFLWVPLTSHAKEQKGPQSRIEGRQLEKLQPQTARGLTAAVQCEGKVPGAQAKKN
ncbi:unnamed protein product [Effrenium voratum]|nr:unnamed protein product [Effrenium voratum]